MAKDTRKKAKSHETRGTIAKAVGEHFSSYISELIDSGRYASVAEVLREALRLHEQNRLTKG